MYTDPTSYDGTKLRVVGSTDFAGGPPLHENEPKMSLKMSQKWPKNGYREQPYIKYQ